MAAFKIGEFVVGQKPDCVRRSRGGCRRMGGRPPVHGLIIPKILRKQFLGKVLKASRIEPGDSVPDFDFSAHQSCKLLRFLWQFKRLRVKAAPNCHGGLDDMIYAELVRARLPIAKRSSSAARTTPSHAPRGTNVIGFATAVTVNVFSENKLSTGCIGASQYTPYSTKFLI